MQYIDFCENGINVLFKINDDKRLMLLNMSSKKYDESLLSDAMVLNCLATEVQLTGANINATHGAKHVGHLCPTLPLYESHTDSRNENGRILTFVLKSSMLKITLTYQFYDGIKVVSAKTTVENISDESACLEYVSSFCLSGIGKFSKGNKFDVIEMYTPHNEWAEEIHWQKDTLRHLGFNPIKPSSTKRICISNTGVWSTKEYLPMGMIHNTETDDTLLWQIEHNGSWNWELNDAANMINLRVSGPSANENGWWKELAPGEVFEAVPVAVAVTTGGFGEAVREMTEYRRIITKHIVDLKMPVIFNDYMLCLNASPTTEKEIPLIEKAAKMGAEIFCMDAGWYSPGGWWELVGEWKECPDRFPNGLKEVFDLVRAHGMIPGIWIEPEVMGVRCPLVPEFEDCFFKRHGRNIIDHGRYQLDFSKKKVTDYLDSVIDRLIADYGIGFFKFDYNIEGGIGTEADADSFGDGLLKYNKAYLKWIDGLYERHPGLLIENCSSGGMRMEYGTLKHFHLQSITDSFKYFELAYMSVMAPSAVIPEQAGVWVVPLKAQTDGENVYSAVNGLLHRFYFSGETALLDDAQAALLKEAIDVYKEIRYDIIGSVPYFPCGITHFEDEWQVSARVSGSKKTLYVTVGHTKGSDDKKVIDLKAVPGKKKGAKILYPSGSSANISVDNDILTVSIGEKDAVLIAMELE